MKNKPIKARKAAGCYGTELFALGGYMVGARAYWLLPRDAASYDQMLNQVHAAIANDPDYAGIAHHQWLDLAVTVLAAIGIKRQ